MKGIITTNDIKIATKLQETNPQYIVLVSEKSKVIEFHDYPKI